MNKVLMASAVSAAFAFAAPSCAQSSDAPADVTTVVAAAPAAEASASEGAAFKQRAFRSPTERVEARLAYLKAALKITDAQSVSWESFASVMRKQAGDMEQRMQQRRAQRAAQGAERAERRNVSAIERLERTQQRMAMRSARLNEVITAAKPLYAALTPEQQQIADTMLARQSKRGGHRGHHRHGHGGHRGA